MSRLAQQWREEAKRFRAVQEEDCAIGDDEWFLCKTEADRLEQCANELEADLAHIEADLAECLDYFKDRYDVVDGDYGEPAPNTEMRLGMMIDETLNGRPV